MTRFFTALAALSLSRVSVSAATVDFDSAARSAPAIAGAIASVSVDTAARA